MIPHKNLEADDQAFLAGRIEFLDIRNGKKAPEVFPLWDNAIFKIGRDPSTNNLAIEGDSNTVSRNHCEVYVIMYEATVFHSYVRDRKSSNGTYVNGSLIGREKRMSSGYLLEDGDLIEIRPFWKFIYRQIMPTWTRQLTAIQVQERKLFEKKYTLTERCLGYGSQATAHLGINVKMKKQLVCKLVNLTDLRRCGSSRLCRIYQEVEILHQLQHPNILPYVDAIISPYTLYIFTELASGGDLTSFANRHSHVPEFDIRIIVRQVIHGLQYLHGKEIVHRDLKPENILLACSPKIAYHRIMLADFGTSAVPYRNRMITSVGTTCYQAPEIGDNTQTQTTAVDIWSLGIVALMLLSTSGTVEVGNFSRLNQASIDQSLEECFQCCAPQPSVHGQCFVRQCLRVAVAERLESDQAGYHDWFCTPEKHLEFFIRFDRRIMTEYSHQSQVRPLPLKLPDVRGTTEIRGDAGQGLSITEGCETSRHFEQFGRGECAGAQPAPQIRDVPHRPEASMEEASISPLQPPEEPQLSAVVDLNTIEHRSTASNGLDAHITPLIPFKTLTLDGNDNGDLPKPRSTIKYGRKHQAMRRKTKPKIYHDATFLPPADLTRHMKSKTRSMQRERILSKLEKTQRRFLSEVTTGAE